MQADDRIFPVGCAAGAYDMFHVGHLNILLRARERCEHLIASVATDDAVFAQKGRKPIVPLAERIEILQHIDVVDEVVAHEADHLTLHAQHPFDAFFKGSDWAQTEKGNRLEAEFAARGVTVVYLPYTETTSSTHLRAALEGILSSW